MTEEDLVKTLLVRAIDERDPSLFSTEQVESAESEAGDVTGGAQWVQRRADCLFAFIPEELRLAARVPRISLKALLLASVPAFAVGVASNFLGQNMAAPISSGSFKHDGMFIVSCSMKTLSGVAQGYTENLIQRAADVTIKEGRPLLLSPREMPFSAIHLENMLKLSRLGVKIAPPVPGFYHAPRTIDDLIDSWQARSSIPWILTTIFISVGSRKYFL